MTRIAERVPPTFERDHSMTGIAARDLTPMTYPLKRKNPGEQAFPDLKDVVVDPSRTLRGYLQFQLYREECDKPHLMRVAAVPEQPVVFA